MNRCLALLITVFALVCAQQALAQEDMKVLAPEAFGKLTRPAATFVHDQHNEKAGLDDCVICHHGGSNGKKDTSSSTEGTPCSDCHAVKAAKGQTDLNHAYHKLCISCHQSKGKGPVACGQCHKR